MRRMGIEPTAIWLPVRAPRSGASASLGLINHYLQTIGRQIEVKVQSLSSSLISFKLFRTNVEKSKNLKMARNPLDAAKCGECT